MCAHMSETDTEWVPRADCQWSHVLEIIPNLSQWWSKPANTHPTASHHNNPDSLRQIPQYRSASEVTQYLRDHTLLFFAVGTGDNSLIFSLIYFSLFYIFLHNSEYCEAICHPLVYAPIVKVQLKIYIWRLYHNIHL